MYKQLSIAITLCAAAGGFSTAQAQVMCGDVITTSQVLTGNLNCTGFDPALTIQGPGGRLDMRRFTLSCEGSGTDGIDLTNSGARLQNGTVADCRIGVEVDGFRAQVSKMILQANSEDGLELFGSGHRITNTTARTNGEEGFCVDGEGGNFFTGNRATDNVDDGFDTVDGDTYISNVATGNGGTGFFIRGGNLLRQNVAQGNATDGFFVRDEDNTLTRNSARSNLDDGIDVPVGGLDNALRQNKASGNGAADTEGNGGFDLEDDNPDCDNNTWISNTGTRNQPTCID